MMIIHSWVSIIPLYLSGCVTGDVTSSAGLKAQKVKPDARYYEYAVYHGNTGFHWVLQSYYYFLNLN